MSDLTDNQFYPSAEQIWLRKRLNNVVKYRDITLKIMEMEEEKQHQLRMFVIL